MASEVTVEVGRGNIFDLNDGNDIGIYFTESKRAFCFKFKKEYTLQELMEVAQSLVTVIDQEIARGSLFVNPKELNGKKIGKKLKRTLNQIKKDGNNA